MKYLIYKEHGPVLWSGDLTHSQVAYGQNDIAYGEGNEIISGGYVNITIEEGELYISCFGSVDGIKSTKSEIGDDIVIREMLKS